MLRLVRELKKHEEGQALVLAAISMLILAICVMATMNLTFTASQKVRLQNAADAAAYSMAAYEARALNYMAYTNRAMVVQYASQMNILAIVSYLSFTMTIFRMLGQIPYIGIVFQIVAFIQEIFFWIIEVASMIFVPAMDVINLFLSASQAAISGAMLQRTSVAAFQEVRDYDPSYQLSNLSPVNPAQLWTNTVRTSIIPALNPPDNDEDRLNRLIMTEIANSARNDWTAYGGRPTQITLGLIPRYASLNLNAGLVFQMGKIARTELGSRSDGGSGFIGGIVGRTDEIYSADTFYLNIGIQGILTVDFEATFWVNADRQLGGHDVQVTGPRVSSCPIPSYLGGCSFLNWILRPVLEPMQQSLQQFIQQNFRNSPLPHIHFGQMPYARFRPQPSAETLFNQPAVAVLVTMPTTELETRGAPIVSRYGANLGLSSANSTLARDYNGLKQPPRRGYTTGVDMRPGQALAGAPVAGLHAASAALAYYHRPGDWREPPNLFNPLWGAKLMAVADHPHVAGNPAVAPLLGTYPGDRMMLH